VSNQIVRKYMGKVVTKEELDKLLPPKKGWLKAPPMVTDTYSEHDPLISEGCGVMKSQVKEARDMIRQHNIQGAAVHDNGQIRFTSRRARKEFLSRRGLVDNEASYGD
jgi:hypothetical protein